MIHVLVLKTGYVESNSVATITMHSRKGFETPRAAITDFANFLFKGWSCYYKPPVDSHPECLAKHFHGNRWGGWGDDFIEYARGMMNWTACSDPGPEWNDTEHDWWPWENFFFFAQYQPDEIVVVHECAAEILFEALTDLPGAYEKTRWDEDSDHAPSPQFFTEKDLKFHITTAPGVKRPPFNVFEKDGKLYLIKPDLAVRLEDDRGEKMLDLAAHVVIDTKADKLTKNMLGLPPK